MKLMGFLSGNSRRDVSILNKYKSRKMFWLHYPFATTLSKMCALSPWGTLLNEYTRSLPTRNVQWLRLFAHCLFWMRMSRLVAIHADVTWRDVVWNSSTKTSFQWRCPSLCDVLLTAVAHQLFLWILDVRQQFHARTFEEEETTLQRHSFWAAGSVDVDVDVTSLTLCRSPSCEQVLRLWV